jgi:hypothetical protein
MATHTCDPGRDPTVDGLLADGCPRCDEHAASVEFSGVPLGLDERKTAALWDLMLAVELNQGDATSYPSANDAKVGRTLYRWGIWLERNVGLNPWRPLADLRLQAR